MPNVLIEILLIIALIILNGYFSMSEIALLSVKKSRLRHLSKQGSKKAQNALFLTRKSPEMLSTIQIGITVIGIFAGAFGGATVAEHLEKFLSVFPPITGYSELISVAVVVIVITYLSLIIGELVPKQIALSNPEKLSLRVAGPIKIIMKIATPLVNLLSSSTTILLKLLHIKPAPEQIVTEDEIKLLIAEGAESGVFERAEQKMVESIFHLGNRPIKDFMTLRNAIIWLDTNDSYDEIKRKISTSDRSIFLLCENTLDNFIGILEVKDILSHYFKGNVEEKINLRNLSQPAIKIDVDTPALVAIERLKRSSLNMALVTDKNSKNKDVIMGIITFHDILEAIVGEIKAN
ncbi:MAG: hypothetical protein US42_C0002G0017 [Candidatus Magasanikbacteria bacterium GW2011_GWC2_37_14]|uniref:HlyC/CorC family transporter n=1 Tax=Candidatus Magasanikbacteria bacterium GW2011_GWC2_37_14 TaxID=1619046 RepID=A0A0G0GDH3_9BACT|nr:MAG: hypothetical protein US42_C0002G0017 [Candidatus Magasanikbacteria bacterium GW2011_GWC2_37_14]